MFIIKGYFVLGCPEYSNENLNHKIKQFDFNTSMFKTYLNYCQKLDFEAFPYYSNENPNNKNKQTWFQIWLNPLWKSI